jgi:hypothetical protein
VKVRRFGLKKWIELSKIRKNLTESGADVPELVFDALSLVSLLSEDDKRLPWFDIEEAFSSLLKENQIRIEFPILRKGKKSKKDTQTPPWEYIERDWYFWLHRFAKEYGWDREYIAELDIDDVYGLYQEIQVEDQLEKEFIHSLSEISYEYNKATKNSRYKPLSRPSWMTAVDIAELKQVIKRKIPRSMIPPGIVIRVEAKDDDKS